MTKFCSVPGCSNQSRSSQALYCRKHAKHVAKSAPYDDPNDGLDRAALAARTAALLAEREADPQRLVEEVRDEDTIDVIGDLMRSPFADAVL